MKPILLTLLPILLLALLVRVGMGILVYRSHTHETFIDIHGDTAGYLQIGERMYDRKSYTAGTQAHRNRGLVRPPGYPAFYTWWRGVCRWFDHDLRSDMRPIIWPQIVLSLLQVIATYFIALLVLRSRLGASIAGSIAALTPTSIAAATLPMPDSTFAAFFSVTFLGFVISMTRRETPLPGPTALAFHANPCPEGPTASSPPSHGLGLKPNAVAPNRDVAGISKTRHHLLSLAGLALAVAALLKPAAIYWPILAVPMLLLVHKLRWSTFADLRRLFLPLILVVGLWSTYNYMAEGTFIYSNISARNMRYGVMTKVELAAEKGRLPTNAEAFEHTSKLTRRDADFLNVEFGNNALLQQRITRETRQIALAHPIWTIRVGLDNLRGQLTTRYKVIQKQLPDTTQPLVKKIRKLVDATDTPLALIAWYGLMLAAVPLAWLARDRAALLRLIACWAGFTYIVLPTASVGAEGSRLILAAEPMAAVLIGASVVYALRLLRGGRVSSPAAWMS